MTRHAAIMATFLVQLIIIGLFFLGFLLDPLLGVWIVGIYFFIGSTYLTYYFFHSPRNKNNESG